MLLKRTLLLMLVGCMTGLAAAQPTQEKQDWLVLEKTEQGLPVIALAVKKIPEDEVRKLLPWLATVEWKYAPDAKGMPDEQTLKRMYKFEDDVEASLGGEAEAKFMFSETGNGVRRLQYYTKNHRLFSGRIQQVGERYSKAPKVVSVVHDPQWTAHRNLLLRVKK